MNKVKLKEATSKITDGSHYSPLGIKSGYPMLSSKDMRDNDFDYSDVKHISEEDYFALVKNGCKPEVDDVLIIKDGNSYLKKAFVVKEEKDIVLLSSIGILRPNKNIIDPYYLKYYLLSDYVQSAASKYVTGSAIPRVILANFGEIEIPLPSVQEQQKISLALKAIDDKIENNNAICADLEGMAKLLYDYWFVQFDFPDENGKPYKSSGGKMVWNEELKREIPEGWVVNKMLTMCDVVDCLHSQKPSFCYERDDCYMLTLDNLSKNGTLDLSQKYYIAKSDYQEWTSRIEVRENDFLVTNAGRAGDICKVPHGVKCAIGRNITAIRPTTINPYYLRCFFKSSYLKTQVMSNLDCGSFFMSFNVRSIKQLQILVPNNRVMKSFIDIIEPAVVTIEDCISENQELAALRDFLLPMLMNGQVKVKETIA